jgi:putative intracellular protease/amidase
VTISLVSGGVLLRISSPSSSKARTLADRPDTMRVGVLALQGSFAEHLAAVSRFASSGVVGVPVTTPAHLASVDALILPGGESTSMGVGLIDSALLEPVKAFVASGKPAWGICAGMILLADTIESGSQPLSEPRLARAALRAPPVLPQRTPPSCSRIGLHARTHTAELRGRTPLRTQSVACRSR